MTFLPSRSLRQRSTSKGAAGKFRRDHPYATAALAGAAALGVAAIANHKLAARAERRNPPEGKFMDIGGVRLHFLERGSGPPLVLLHGNGGMIQDFQSSGLVDRAAERFRVIVFDRPGYGHTSRPRRTLWSPGMQAALIAEALQRLGAEPAIVLGHSWGASVAVALALDHPARVRGLTLVSGYYYPTARLDVPALSAPAVPILGDVIRHTLGPLATRLAWPALLRMIFGPPPVPAKFAEGFPVEMAVRPSQLRASAAEAMLMIPDAAAFRSRYAEIVQPVVIVAGEEDRLVNCRKQSLRLHHDIPHSQFRSVAGAGHMVHQTDMPAVLDAIELTARSAPAAESPGG